MATRDSEPDQLAAALAELEAVRRVPGWLPEPPEREPARRMGRRSRRRGPRPDLPPPDQWRYADAVPPAAAAPPGGPSHATAGTPLSRAALRAQAATVSTPLVRAPVAFRQVRLAPGRRAVLGVLVVALVVIALFATRVLLARANSQPHTFGPPVALSGVPTPSAPVTGRSASGPTRSAGAGATSAVVDRIEVHVLGQVARPGVVTVPADARVQDVVRAAGGLLDSADLTRVNLARRVQDGEQIVVPRPGQEVTTAPGPAPAGDGTAAPSSPVDLNAADASALDALPGVGPVLAARIVQYRDTNGPFRSIDQLDEVSGIGAKLMEQLRPLVRV